MAQGFTDAQLAQLAALVNGALDSRLGTVQAATVPTVSPASVAAVVIEPAESKKSAKITYTVEQVAAQRAADLIDPNRNAYTVVARNQIVGQYLHADYVAVWTPVRDRLLAQGLGKQAANKQAQVIYSETLKAEVIRLKHRDGLSTGRTPVVDPETIRSQGTHSDPTGNQAANNVDRENARIAELERELAVLKGAVIPAPVSVPLPAVRSAASVAQAAIGANPRERWITKLMSDAKASPSAAGFIQAWLTGRKQSHPNSYKNSVQIARTACERLGIPTK